MVLQIMSIILVIFFFFFFFFFSIRYNEINKIFIFSFYNLFS
jgi:hypothetical protein